MMRVVPFLLWCLLLVSRSSSIPNQGRTVLQNKLRYYETLRKDQLTWKHLTHVLPHITVVRLTTHGRTLHLNLTPHPTIWSKDFSAVTEDDHGKQARLPLNRNHFYIGTVLGANGSSVVAHLPTDGLMTAVVRLSPDEVYHVERSHLHIHESHDYHMITYLESDMKQDEKEVLLDSVVTGVEIAAQSGSHESGGERRRLRRQTSSLCTQEMACGLAVVADHRFTTGFAESSPSLAASLMVAHVIDIDSIYRNTFFNGDTETFCNYGLQISRLIVHTNATADPEHYNRAEPFGSDQLLTAFSISDWSGVCLAHLFTYHQFTDGRLGLAYIASTSTAGGICDTARRFDSGVGSDVSFNSGFSSYLNPSGRQLLQQEGIHATAHEIGHGWGSDHDSTSAEGGPFLMHPFALSGEQDSHRTFSDASRGDIGRVLEVRGSCFQATTQGLCGNGILEEGEECDAGFSEGFVQCCDATDCTLLPGKTCSDSNHACCSECQPSRNGSICRRADRLNCRADSLCNGVNVTCGDGALLPNGSDCLLGECQLNGAAVECFETCDLMGQDTCSCSSTNQTLGLPEVAACRVCCQDRTTSNCEDVNRNRSTGFGCQYLDSSGMTVSGTCEEGVCVFSADFFRLAAEDPGIVVVFFQFLATNIVGTVAFLTFVVFLPPSLLLHFLYDRYYYQKYIKKVRINKSKATLRNRRQTHRQKPPREEARREASLVRGDRTSSEEHLLPHTTENVTQL